MKKIEEAEKKTETLQKILSNHKKWLDGNGGESADLRGANLPPAPVLLTAFWEEVSDNLCRELMRYDAANHPDPKKFDEWAKGGSCPYSGGFQRAANFKEERGLWKPGPSKSAHELVLMLFTEKDIKYSENL